MGMTGRSFSSLGLYFVLMYTISAITNAADECSYPDEIQGRRYLTEKRIITLPTGGVVVHQYIDYDINNADISMQFAPNMPATKLTQVTCEASILDGTTLFYRRKADNRACSQLTPVNDGAVILYKDIETQVFWSPQECQDELYKATDESLSWYIAYPFESPTACPLPDGEYQLTCSLTDGDVQCADDETSTATVAGDTITFSSCFTGDAAFETPMSLTLQCGGSVTAAEALPGSTNGDVLLLGDYTDFPDDVIYYCSRFTQEGSTIYLSVDISDELITRCNGVQNSKSAEADTYVALVLSQDEPTCDPVAQDCPDGQECRETASGELMCLDDCNPNPCENNGECTETDDGFECDCAEGFTGETCTEDAPVGCDPNPCENGGECTETADGFECDCAEGFTGDTCSEEVFCDPNPCENGGECTETADGFECDCAEGFTGDTCTEEAFCDPNPCENDGECTETAGGFECDCAEGFTGETCTEDAPVGCNPNPCENSGECTETADGFECDCADGFTGDTCTDCDPNVEGVCEDDLVCREISTGANRCLKGCDPNPCKNNGTCAETDNGFDCSCPEGFSGSTCSDDGDDYVIILVVVLLIIAALLIMCTCIAVCCCQRRHREQEEESEYVREDVQTQKLTAAEIANNPTLFVTYTYSNSLGSHNF